MLLIALGFVQEAVIAVVFRSVIGKIKWEAVGDVRRGGSCGADVVPVIV